MIDVLNLALPYFGLILLGYLCGKFRGIPEEGLAWMNFFVIYLALPCLFFRILSQTPFEQLNNIPFIVATTLSTATVFAMSFGLDLAIRKGDKAGATIGALSGAYGNIGYMGPGLALTTLGPDAAVPVALIFCFDNILLFSIVPLLMSVFGTEKKSPGAAALDVIKQIGTHPLVLATAIGVAGAALKFQPPVALDRLMQFLQSAAAPCALFALGLTVALRPTGRLRWEVPAVVAVKLLVHPVTVLALLSLFGSFVQNWVYTAVLMAALPPALNVFVMARQYDTWVEQASSAVLFGTVASLVTLTLVMLLIKSGMLPYPLFH